MFARVWLISDWLFAGWQLLISARSLAHSLCVRVRRIVTREPLASCVCRRRAERRARSRWRAGGCVSAMQRTINNGRRLARLASCARARWRPSVCAARRPCVVRARVGAVQALASESEPARQAERPLAPRPCKGGERESQSAAESSCSRRVAALSTDGHLLGCQLSWQAAKESAPKARLLRGPRDVCAPTRDAQKRPH